MQICLKKGAFTNNFNSFTRGNHRSNRNVQQISGHKVFAQESFCHPSKNPITQTKTRDTKKLSEKKKKKVTYLVKIHLEKHRSLLPTLTHSSRFNDEVRPATRIVLFYQPIFFRSNLNPPLGCLPTHGFFPSHLFFVGVHQNRFVNFLLAPSQPPRSAQYWRDVWPNSSGTLDGGLMRFTVVGCFHWKMCFWLLMIF